MANLLLWNVQRKPRADLLVAAAAEHSLDVLLLVEHDDPAGGVRAVLTGAGYQPVVSDPRFGVFVRPPPTAGRLRVIDPPGRADFFRIRTAARDGLLVLVHGPDRRNAPDAARALLFNRIAAQVRAFERDSGHQRTVLAGDFNSNPFEPSMVDVQGLHALGVRSVSRRPARRVQGQDYDFFYNPMWRLYGHGADAGSATHYYCGGGPAEHVWHMLDQVIVRPRTAAAVPEGEIRVLTAIGDTPLLTRDHRPGRVSDHLPVRFRWDI